MLKVLSGYRPGSYDIVHDAERTCLENVFNISIGLTQYIASGIKSYKKNMDDKNRSYIMAVRNITLRTPLDHYPQGTLCC